MAEVGRVAVRDPGAVLPGGFWAAVAVWLERPQVANKRLCGVRLEARRAVARPRAQPPGSRPGPGPEPEERAAADCGPGQRPPDGAPGPAADDGPQPGAPRGGGPDARPGPDLDSLWAEFCRSLAAGRRDLLAFLGGSGSDSAAGAGAPSEGQPGLDVVLRAVIPKATPRCPLAAPARDIVVQDVPRGAVTFLPLEEDSGGGVAVTARGAYQLRLLREEGEWFISVLVFCPEQWRPDGAVCPRPAWLGGPLLARLARWCAQNRQSGFKSTLSLVPIASYGRTYQRLKAKYKGLVQVWPEVTDPEKFVFEDVAIAAYLLVLWEEERAERGLTARQSFVDLGCGNGLLVHILSGEGHPGRGIDVRRRKIWDAFGPQTRLEEGAITPGDEACFPDADWLLGNHSDELTPWIPVMAARSSYDCRFFVLPCCFFDFAGRFRRRQSGRTQYREYLDFVRQAAEACGFLVQEDCLRIPSTKRVCLVGKARTYPPGQEAAADARRTRYISSRQGPAGPAAAAATPPDGARGGPGRAGAPWLPGFRPRARTERVRNCAALPRALTDQVVLRVAALLLGQPPRAPGSPPAASPGAWNRGGSLSLAHVAGALDRATLQQLKRECGGLQTLLRNSHQVFEVLKGSVRLRDWREEVWREAAARRLSSGAAKTRLCWFFTHHPDGCALAASSCPFAHGPGELRPPRSPQKQQESL